MKLHIVVTLVYLIDDLDYNANMAYLYWTKSNRSYIIQRSLYLYFFNKATLISNDSGYQQYRYKYIKNVYHKSHHTTIDYKLFHSTRSTNLK